MSKSRTSNFCVAEDRHLCRIFLETSNDPNVYESKFQFWKHIAEKYHSEKPNSQIKDRSQRSLQSRIGTILKDTRKFNVCLQQVDGADDQLHHEHANELLMQQKDYNSGFKFGHVWSMLKDFVQAETTVGVSSPSPSPAEDLDPLSSFSINLGSDENNITSGIGTSSQSKLKRKPSDDICALKEENEKLREILRDRDAELQMKKIEAKNRKSKINELMREDNILMINLETISDPERREFFRLEQQQIMQKRRQAQQQGVDSTASNNERDWRWSF